MAELLHQEGTKAGGEMESTLTGVQNEIEALYGFRIEIAGIRQLFDVFAPKTYERWIQQFDVQDRFLAYKLYCALRVYSNAELVALFTSTLEKKIPRAVLKNSYFIGIGSHQGKSGPHLLYHFTHIYRKLFPDVKSDELALRFADLNSFQKDWPNLNFPVDALVIIDDFIGSGHQAIKELSALKRQKAWKKLTKYFIIASGFEAGVKNVTDQFPELTERILVADKLMKEDDRAFGRRLFPDEKERNRAKSLCNRIGQQILSDRFEETADRKKHSLGWQGDQAFVVFDHNTPNNTLPIFWGTGNYRGKRWIPLYERKK